MSDEAVGALAAGPKPIPRERVHFLPEGPDKDGHLYRVGKKAAGHLLDGREWREFPA